MPRLVKTLRPGRLPVVIGGHPGTVIAAGASGRSVWVHERKAPDLECITFVVKWLRIRQRS
jgi:hypothetical protein